MKTFNASLLKSLSKAFWGQKYWRLAEMKTPAKPFLYGIDSPQSQNALSAAFVIVNGWIVGNESIAEHNSVLSCPNCGSEFQLNSNHYNFLNSQLTDYGKVTSTASISANIATLYQLWKTMAVPNRWRPRTGEGTLGEVQII